MGICAETSEPFGCAVASGVLPSGGSNSPSSCGIELGCAWAGCCVHIGCLALPSLKAEPEEHDDLSGVPIAER